MSDITYDKFDIGLDRRKSASTSESNRLQECKNAHITQGKVIRKRPGSTLQAALETGTKGLFGANGLLNTFYPYNATPITHSDSLFQANELNHALNTAYASGTLSKIHSSDVFSGYIYLAAEYSDGNTFHYYLDGAAGVQNLVIDVACPHSKNFLKMTEKIYGIDAPNNQILYTMTSAPKTWTAGAGSGDAGNLATGNQAKGSSVPVALGEYQDRLSVFMSDSMQLWNVGAVDTDFGFYKKIGGIGTKYPNSVNEFAGDIVFASKAGFRSIGLQVDTGNLIDNDIGSPIDSIVKPLISDTTEILSEYFPTQGQLWQVINGVSTATVYVYTFSRTMSISAWSEYEYPFVVDAITSLDGYVYLRSGDNVYKVDETGAIYTDNGAAYEMRVELPFLDFKLPGSSKYIKGMDIVCTGTVDIQFRYDPNNPALITDPITLSGDTRVSSMIPVEITTTSIAPVITSAANELVQIDAITFYYDNLGAF